MKNVFVSYSGGLDSTILLLYLINNDFDLNAISFDYGQKHKNELICAKDICKMLGVKHRIIDLTTLTTLLNSTLVTGGSDVPEGHYSGEEMKLTVVPNRNKIFNSIIQSIALSDAQKTNKLTYIASGVHAGSGKIYPDTTIEFNDADFNAFRLGNWQSELITRIFPFNELSKTEVVKLGIKLCEELNLDYKTIFSNTFTSYKPIKIDGRYCSDIKSSSSLKRIEAFKIIGIPDPVIYSDDRKILSWTEVVKLTKHLI